VLRAAVVVYFEDMVLFVTRAFFFALGVIALLLQACTSESPAIDSPQVSGSKTPNSLLPISFIDASSLLGEDIQSKTFSLAVSDLSGDGEDDILIGAHGQDPYLYIREGVDFTNYSTTLFPQRKKSDRHGYTIADLDNDDDLDIAIASGGSDGVGKGSPNIFLINTTSGDDLSFQSVEVDSDLSLRRGRSRSFIPVASPDGRTVDLYYATLLRQGYPNMMMRNAGIDGKLGFSHDTDHFLSHPINDHGRGVIADLDGDGNNDYLVIDGNTARLLWHPISGKAPIVLASNAYSVKVADFSNDGALDIFIGRAAQATHSDRVTENGSELIYVITKNRANDISSISFKSYSAILEMKLSQHIRATSLERPDGASDIFLGKQLANPDSRDFVVEKTQAQGKPDQFLKAGIYIWYSSDSQEWTIKWKFHSFLDVFKGVIRGEALSGLTTSGLSIKEPAEISDMILINKGAGEFEDLRINSLAHRLKTVATTVADFNNDGWLDIAGVRHGEQGAANGRPFILTNNPKLAFSLEEMPRRAQDKLHRADLIAHGFFNDDQKPDLIITNGFGQIPGTWGSSQLLLNNTPAAGKAILVHLKGTHSNRFGIGAAMMLTDVKGRPMGYRVQGLNTNISQDTYWQHFGLGTSEPPYSLEVHWPDKTIANYHISGPGRYQFQQ
jgi:guanyl-specific ribonuclease Sa